MEYIFGIILPLAFYVFIIWIIVKAVKKNKKRKLTEKYTNELKKATQTVANSPFVFEKFYDNTLAVNNVIPDELIGKNLSGDITDFKNKYYSIINDLISISNNNTVFFTSSDEWNAFEECHPDFSEQKDIISKDIIKTMPILAKYVNMYNTIDKNKKTSISLVGIAESLWIGMDYISEEDDGSDKFKDHKKYLDCAIGNCWKKRDNCIRDYILSTIPPNDTQSRDIFFNIYKNNEQLRTDWISIYYDGMKNAAIKRGYMDYFGDYLNLSIEAGDRFDHLSWYRHLSFSGDMHIYSSLGCIKEKTSDEYMRIHKLYKTGQMKGRYSELNDPKYATNKAQ